MKFFTKCNGCRQRRFYIAKRTYKTKKMGVITSNDELCRSCYNKLKPLAKNI